MSRQLPSHPNLDHLKKQAKHRLGELQKQQPGAKLADALHETAREYGSADGKTLTVSSKDASQNAQGWQSDFEQVIVLDRR